jgi:hypothetical protein
MYLCLKIFRYCSGTSHSRIAHLRFCDISCHFRICHQPATINFMSIAEPAPVYLLTADPRYALAENSVLLTRPCLHRASGLSSHRQAPRHPVASHIQSFRQRQPLFEFRLFPETVRRNSALSHYAGEKAGQISLRPQRKDAESVKQLQFPCF